jgi:hypothetical protein
VVIRHRNPAGSSLLPSCWSGWKAYSCGQGMAFLRNRQHCDDRVVTVSAFLNGKCSFISMVQQNSSNIVLERGILKCGHQLCSWVISKGLCWKFVQYRNKFPSWLICIYWVTLQGNFGLMLHACSLSSLYVLLRARGHVSNIVLWLFRCLQGSVRWTFRL